MKKALTYVLIFATCFILTACDPSSSSYQYILPEASIVGVELIDYDNPDAKKINTFIPITLPRIRRFDFDKMNTIEALKPEKIDAFSEDLLDIYVWGTWVHLNSPAGKSIRIIYSDDSFDVLSLYDTFAGRYDENGKPIDHFGDLYSAATLIELANSYFSVQLETVPDTFS